MQWNLDKLTHRSFFFALFDRFFFSLFVVYLENSGNWNLYYGVCTTYLAEG